MKPIGRPRDVIYFLKPFGQMSRPLISLGGLDTLIKNMQPQGAIFEKGRFWYNDATQTLVSNSEALFGSETISCF